MKKIRILLIMVICTLGIAACGDKEQSTVSNENKPAVEDTNTDASPNTVTTETTPAPTKEPSTEVTDVAPTEEPVAEATPEPTEEPVLYPGIDMESDLPGQQWLETFVGIIEEPKVVVFSDITGKKVIVEQEGEVAVNLDEDAMALFFPEGYKNGNVSSGILTSNKEVISTENYEIFYLDAEKMREVEESEAAFVVYHGEEKIVLIVNIKIE